MLSFELARFRLAPTFLIPSFPKVDPEFPSGIRNLAAMTPLLRGQNYLDSTTLSGVWGGPWDERPIAAGPSGGRVHLADWMGYRVAIKEARLFDHDEYDTLADFVREAQALSLLPPSPHFNTVRG